MTDDATPQRIGWLYQILGGGPTCMPKLEASGQDVFMRGPKGSLRYGYFSGNMFFRENPVPRSGFRHLEDSGTYELMEPRLKERLVKWGVSEPQYDMVIQFNPDGTIAWVKDSRTCQEVDQK